MDEIGLFPLRLVLLPTERIALHIFEPRYRELIGECIDLEQPFGLVLELDDGMALHGTRATVSRVLQELEDGRLNIVVAGGERFRIERLTSGRAFQTAEVVTVEDDDDASPPEDVARALELFARVVELTDSKAEVPVEEGALFSFDLAARIELPPDLKQELLEMTSPRERLERTIELLEQAVEAVDEERELQRRAAGNGKVELPPDTRP